MKKSIFKITVLTFITCLFLTHIAFCEEDDWAKHLDVYNGDGLARPVNAIDFQKTMKELQKLKDKVHKSETKQKIKKGEAFPEPATENAPVKSEKKDIVKIVNPLYYDGQTLQPGFYKIACEAVDNEYFIKFSQGKTPVMKVKAMKTSHMNFCPDKLSCIETEIYQNKYYKVNFKTIDYAVSAYLAIVE